MANEKFYLIFPDQPTKRILIDEPINFSEIEFILQQKEGKHGRDESFGGEKVQLQFSSSREHYLDRLLEIYNKDYFEGDVKWIVALETGTEFVGEIDFYTADSDDITYFNCSVIVQSSLQIVKRRTDTKVDMFSSKDINGDYIEPLVPINMLLQSKPTIQISQWEQPVDYFRDFRVIDQIDNYYNPCQNLIKSEIKDTFTFYNQYSDNKGDFELFKAFNNLKNVKLQLDNINVFVHTDGSNDAAVLVSVNYGATIETSTQINLYNVISRTEDISFNESFTVDIPAIQRGESVWFSIRVIMTLGGGNMSIKGMKMLATTESTAYNSITPCFRLIDVMRQIVKSISGLEIYAPRYDNGGEFYDNVLTNGNLLRNVTDKPFYVSLEDIEKSINPEHNADSEIAADGRVFFGIEKDFYTNEECGFFDDTQFSSMKKRINPIYGSNKYSFKYGKYQALKEELAINSADTIHGESIWQFFNQRVENGKECVVQWVRDTFLLEEQRQKSLIVSEDTATQDDDTLFAIDSIATENDQTFTESTTLQHTYNGSTLSLRNDGSVNFIVLGIKAGTTFVIEYPDPNFGDYTVDTVGNTELILTRVSLPAITDTNNGLRLTKYTYTILQETIPLTNRTNEGFTAILNLTSPERYSNLRYSVKRNIVNYWNSFLATVNLARKAKALLNTYYKNNGLCETEYAGLRVIENGDYIPSNPIVSPFLYEEMIFTNVELSEYLLLQDQIRTRRGFIRCIDQNSRALKIYPSKMSYSVSQGGRLTITGVEKYQQSYLTIVKDSGLITVNDETSFKKLIYSVEEGNKIALFDNERYRLYNPILWFQVSVNGAVPETLEQLKSWLDLL